MRLVVSTLLLVVSAFVSSCGTTDRTASAEPKIVILLSIDGFRWDYLERHEAPTLRRLASEGVRAERLIPSFPSKTFPNHYTLVTGLRPATHGIVANWFWDPAFTETFGMSKESSNTQARWWDAGEPIWITAEKQSVPSGCFFWPGSETEIDGLRPTLWRKFDGKLPTNARVDGLLAWFDLPAEQRPRFFTLYFDIVDHAGHNFGPLAPETGAAVREADAGVERLLAGLRARGLEDRVNLVIVADHGMTECGPDRIIFLEDLMDTSKVRVESTGPNGGVRPFPGTLTAEALAAQIRAKAPPHLQVYLRDEVPAQLHYRRNPRIPDVVLMADEHWNIESRVSWPARRVNYVRGTHGYDPNLPSMGAVFVAHGPAFPRGKVIQAVENIHVYNLLCSLLGITPAKNEGDHRLARAALRR